MEPFFSREEALEADMEAIAESEFPLKLTQRDALPIVTTGLFILGVIGGTWLIGSGICYSLLGCNSGIGGYDALLHFLAGIMEVALLVRLGYGISSDSIPKNIITLVSVSSLISILWEILELAHDHVLVGRSIAHLFTLLRPYTFAQPSNIDTMGDLIATLIASTAAALIILTLQRNRSTNP